MRTVDAVVVIADYLYVSEIGLEAAFEEDEDVFLVGNHLALLLHPLLLDSQLLDPVGDLVSDSGEAAPDFLVVLQHQQVLVDRLEKVLPELLDFLSIDDVAFEEVFRDVDKDTVPIVSEILA